MNFLAHCSLADDAATELQADTPLRTGLLAGAVVGDFIKGPVRTDWPEPLQAGVRLHRKIDAVSNQDEDLRQISNQFPKHLRRFAPIFLDLVADHSLARCWPAHYELDHVNFSQQCYAAIHTYEHFLPPHGQRFFSYMQQQDLLANYDQWAHIERGTQSVLRRLERQELYADANREMQQAVIPMDAALTGVFARLRASWQSWSPL